MRQTGARTGEAGSGPRRRAQSLFISAHSYQDLENFRKIQLDKKSVGFSIQSQVQIQARYPTSLSPNLLSMGFMALHLNVPRGTIKGDTRECLTQSLPLREALDGARWMLAHSSCRGLFLLLSASLSVNAQTLCQGVLASSTLSISLQVNPLSCRHQRRLAKSEF